MTQIKLKRVYEDPESGDGFRVLVDRLWPRGMKKENLKYDLWAKDVTPSTQLREWFHVDEKNRWKEFSNYYLKELKESDTVKSFIDTIKKHKVVTLLYAAKDEKHSHAIILKEFLEKQLSEANN